MNVIDPPVMAGGLPWSWLFLLQRVPFLAIAVGVWMGAWGMGSLVLRRLRVELFETERFFFAGALGLSLASLVMLLLGLCGLLNRWLIIGILVASFTGELVLRFQAGEWKSLAHRLSPRTWFLPPRIRGLVLLVVIPFVFGQLLGAMTPQTDFDVVEYHLGGPKTWFQEGRISQLPYNVYTNFPFLTEMLILAGMVIYGDWQWGALAGQAVIAGFAPLTAIGLYSAGRRWFSPQSGALAALVYLTSPWTYRISIIAYAEGGLACYLFAAIYSVLLIRQRISHSRESDLKGAAGLFLLSGAMSGSAMSCKYTGLTSVIVPVALLLTGIVARSRCPNRFHRLMVWGALFTAGVAASAGPWLAKNAILTGNPVYPLAYRLFGGRDRDEELDQKWRQGHAARTYASWSERWCDLPVKVIDVMANNDWHSPLMFGLAPLSLCWFFRQRKLHRQGDENVSYHAANIAILWLYVVWQFGTWWLLTHHIDRFYVPMFSVVALLSGIGLTLPIGRNNHTRVRSGSRMIWNLAAGCFVVASVLYNIEVMLYLGGFNAGRLDLTVARQIAIAPRIRWLNELYHSGKGPPEMKVLCVGEAGLFHAEYPYLYNTVFDRCLFEELCRAPGESSDELRPVEAIRQDFRRLGVTHVDVNWAEIDRYRAPGSYGYSKFVQPRIFEQLQALGLLGPSLFTARDEKSGQISSQLFPVLNEE